jgi:hypothetical protein
MVPVGDIATKLGIPEDVADAAVKQVLPGLAQNVVGGLLGGLLGGGKK